MAAGELPPPVKIGKTTRIVVAEIDEYVERLKSRRDRPGMSWRGDSRA